MKIKWPYTYFFLFVLKFFLNLFIDKFYFSCSLENNFLKYFFLIFKKWQLYYVQFVGNNLKSLLCHPLLEKFLKSV